MLKNLFKKKQTDSATPEAPNNDVSQQTPNNTPETNNASDNETQAQLDVQQKKTLDEQLRELEAYVESNNSKVFNYIVAGITGFVLLYLIMAFIPSNLKNQFSAYWNHQATEEQAKQTESLLKKTTVSAKLKLEIIPMKYTKEQTEKYIQYVGNYIDKFKGEQSLYLNVLEFISNNCVNPANENTRLLVKALTQKMTEHDTHFDENTRIFKKLTDQCSPVIEKYELPTALQVLRNEYFKFSYIINHRYMEIEHLQQKYGKENIHPQTGDFLMNFIPEHLKVEQNERRSRFSSEDKALSRIKSEISYQLSYILRDKNKPPQEAFLTFSTIMRDYGNEFSFFYDSYAEQYGVKEANRLRSEVERVLEYNRKLQNQ